MKDSYGENLDWEDMLDEYIAEGNCDCESVADYFEMLVDEAVSIADDNDVI